MSRSLHVFDQTSDCLGRIIIFHQGTLTYLCRLFSNTVWWSYGDGAFSSYILRDDDVNTSYCELTLLHYHCAKVHLWSRSGKWKKKGFIFFILIGQGLFACRRVICQWLTMEIWLSVHGYIYMYNQFCPPPQEVRKGDYWIRHRLSVRLSDNLKSILLISTFSLSSCEQLLPRHKMRASANFHGWMSVHIKQCFR